jgi:hypothetical protein
LEGMYSWKRLSEFVWRMVSIWVWICSIWINFQTENHIPFE